MIGELATALAEGRLSALGLAVAALERIAAFDRAGPMLNAVPILNPDALEDALASDLRRAAGQTLGPLDSIP